MSAQSTPEYRDVPGFPGYRVGDDGSVWSRWVRRTRKLGAHWVPMAPRRRPDGYLSVGLTRDGRRKHFPVNRLVLIAFAGTSDGDYEVAHENGNRADNRLENLRWKTPAENYADKFRHGTVPLGSKCGSAKLDEGSVRIIRRLIADGVSQPRIARRFGVSRSAVSWIATGHYWRHVR